MAIVDPPPDRAHHDARVLAAVIALASSSAQLTAKYNEIQMNSDKLYCVIQKHDATCDLNSPNEDAFLWINCLVRTKLKKLYAAYRGLSADHEDAILMIGDMAIPETGQVCDLPPPTNRILLIKATKPEPSSSQITSSASPQTARQPLQPVNRQFSAMPEKSADETAVKRERGLSAVTEARPQPAQRSATHNLSASPQHVESEVLRSVPQPSGISTAQTSPPPQPTQEINEEPASMPEQEYLPQAQEPLFSAQDDYDLDCAERGVPLAQLANEETPERLEAGVSIGLKVLSGLESAMKKLGANEDATAYLNLIDRTRKEAVQTRTVVGVVGNTGAGKSSVINALLDEERLVPTNCMRACTAVVTELSYNHSSNEAAKYRAEIEFIKPEEWRKELNVLFKEVFDDEGRISKEVSNPDSEAGVAYAKMRSVYHKKTREMLSNSSVQTLMNDKKVRSVLGTTRKINARDPSTFYKSLQRIIDSKEKGQEKLDKNGNINHNVKREFEHWPLIKVVKIYLKAPALSTGAVIVDLPGVHDSNAARAAVAEGYMKQCTGLWIVAPINRAVDDKAAKTLLGDTFKRQLKFDGTYSAVSFICSKTDDISRTEAADSLQLGDQMTELDARLNLIDEERRKVKRKKREAEDHFEDQEAVYDEVDGSLEVWEELMSQLENGKTVYAPQQDRSKKRKLSSSSPPPRKRPHRAIDSDDDTGEAVETASDPERQALTEEDIAKKLGELKQLKKEARNAKNDAKARIGDVGHELKRLDEEEAELEAKKSAICIAGRNEYSRGAIRLDFAKGIKELDEEEAQDSDDFNPEEDLRDYDEVARSLPVFCVSSRAYQKLSGRMKNDNAVPGFTQLSETEIPQLQAHAKKLTVKGRQANCRRFLNSLKQLMLSLALWSSDDGTGNNLTLQQRDVEKTFLSRKLKELEAHLDKVVETTLSDVAEEMSEQLLAKLTGSAVDAAVRAAGPKAESWGMPKPDGGLHWSTYRATVRRNGNYAGSSGPRDFNAELAEPIYKHLASAWEKTFQRRLPSILQSFKRSATSVVKQFHTAVETRTRERGTGAARLNLLAQQLDQYSATFGDLCSKAVTSLNEGQRDINREFVPAIAVAMEPAYNEASEEKGTGSFKRMKGRVNDHVTTSKQQMFHSAAEQVRRSLLKLCGTIKESMLCKADEVYLAMQRDYTSVLSGVNVGDIQLSREERATRREVDQLITGADEHFAEVMQGELDELKDKFDAQTPSVEKDQDVADDHMDVDDFEDVDSESDADEDGNGSDGAESAQVEEQDMGGATPTADDT